MSGIAGYLSKTLFKADQIIKITSAIGHRGTEEEGFVLLENNNFQQKSGLAGSPDSQKRYPLIQPNNTSNLMVGFRGKNTQFKEADIFQPVVGNDVLLAFDGVIFNIREIKTALGMGGEIPIGFSPAQLLLNAYLHTGLDFIHRLKGQFAITIIDKRIGKIYLVRDQVGIKPLFYFIDHQRFIWSSEIKGILACDDLSPKISMEGLLLNYQFKTTLPPFTCFENVYSVLPGNIFSFEMNDFEHKTQTYWKIPTPPRKESMGTKEALSILEEKLNKIVEQQIQTDFPITSMLSGGVDSGIVTSIFSRIHRDPTCYTLSIDGTGKGLDEEPQAGLAANFFGAQQMIQMITEEEIAQHTPLWIEWFEEPYVGPDVSFPAMEFLQKRQVPITLTGNGGDELFGGYSYVLNLKKWRQLQRFSKPIRMLGDRHAQIKKAKYYAGLKTPGQFFLSATTGLRDYDLAKLIKGVSLEEIQTSTNRLLQPEKFGTDYDGTFYFDLKYSIGAHHVYHDDICAQRFGIEVRYPFLDPELITWVANLPVEIRYNGKETKPLLRKLAKKHLPPENQNLPKKGFRMPQDRVLEGNPGLNKFYREQIKFLKSYGLFVPEEVDRICSEAKSKGDFTYVWQLITTAVWLKAYL